MYAQSDIPYSRYDSVPSFTKKRNLANLERLVEEFLGPGRNIRIRCFSPTNLRKKFTKFIINGLNSRYNPNLYSKSSYNRYGSENRFPGCNFPY